MMRAALIVSAAALLAACGEKPQTASTGRSDAAPFQGTSLPYQVQGWKAGDKAAWEQQIKTRTQAQNDYAKVN